MEASTFQALWTIFRLTGWEECLLKSSGQISTRRFLISSSLVGFEAPCAVRQLQPGMEHERAMEFVACMPRFSVIFRCHENLCGASL